MKRYLVFHGQHYYPSGGWYDFDRTFEKLEEAISYAKSKIKGPDGGWCHVVDLDTMETVFDK